MTTMYDDKVADEAPVNPNDSSLLEEELAVRERLRVDPNAIDEDLSRAAGDIAYAGARHARTVLAHGRAKIGTKKIRALAMMNAKERAIDVYGEKKATVDVIKAMVDLDPAVVAAEELELEMEAAMGLAKTNVAATQARKDMLVQVAATRRAEIERDPVVMSRRGRPGYTPTENESGE